MMICGEGGVLLGDKKRIVVRGEGVGGSEVERYIMGLECSVIGKMIGIGCIGIII